jgi:site-specific DNA recombinase
VSAEQFALVQDRLQRNKRTSPRNTRRPSLLQGILVCRECGYAYYLCSTRSKNGTLREYYRCSGADGHRRPEGRVCENRPVRLAEVDELVWTRVLGLLDDPTLLFAALDTASGKVIGSLHSRHRAIEFESARRTTSCGPRQPIRSSRQSPYTAHELPTQATSYSPSREKRTGRSATASRPKE